MFTHTKKLVVYVAVVTVLALGLTALAPVGTVAAAAIERGGPGGNGSGQGVSRGSQGGGSAVAPRGSGVALTPLSADEQTALQEAILEEYGALNLYNQVIAQFGSVYPFAQIARSEQMHVSALVRQAEKYGVTVPENPGLTSVPTFATVTQACQAGVAAEIADAALYDTLMPLTTHTDLLRVYESLQKASLESHLLAFQTCD